MKEGKCIVLSAPSGSGKTTIAKFLLNKPELNLMFSISATSRAPRSGETHGEDYYFLSKSSFENKIKNKEFVEYEEVYPGSFYGTLLSELDDIWSKGKHVIFDIDVVGGLNIKSLFPEKTCTIFIMPPSLELLENRLRNRKTESDKHINMRLKKAKQEMSSYKEFEHIVINDDLESAQYKVYQLVASFLQP